VAIIRNRKRNQKREEYYFDYTLLFIVLFFLGFGLVMLYSTSSYEAAIEFNGNSAYYLKKQIFNSVVGICAMMVITFIDYRIWERFATFGYIASAVLIVLVLSPLGIERNGARRWLNLGISLQPAEVAKLAIIIFMAAFICKLGSRIKSWKGFWITFFIPAPLALMIFKITDNLSSGIIVFGIGYIMLFIALPDYKKILLVTSAIASIGAIVVFVTIKLAENGVISGFRGRRLLAWLNPEAYASDVGLQTLQALYAIGAGENVGKGLGQSMQKLGYLPEAQNDMIFSIICEELGLFGAIAIILLFVLLIWRCMLIANNAKDRFGALLVVGVMAHFAIQVILNIAVVTNVIPNTGITLPFISYGGSAILFLLSEIGLVLSVSRRIQLKETN